MISTGIPSAALEAMMEALLETTMKVVFTGGKVTSLSILNDNISKIIAYMWGRTQEILGLESPPENVDQSPGAMRSDEDKGTGFRKCLVL